MKFWVLAVALVACVEAQPVNTGWTLPKGNIGLAGIVRKDGVIEPFSYDLQYDIVAIGPSGIVTKSGKNYQLDENLNRQKRSAGVGQTEAGVGSDGWTGIVLNNGKIISFTPELMKDIMSGKVKIRCVSVGESGIITKSGKNVKLTRDLTRVKRHIINEGAMLTSWGHPVVFRKPYTTILLEGPSAIILSDGQLIQKPAGLH